MSKITRCGRLLFLIVLVFTGTAGTKNCKKNCKKYLENKEMVTYMTYRFFEEPPQELSDIWGFRVSAVDEGKNWSILQNSKKEPLEGSIMFKKMVKKSLKEKPYEFWVNGIKITDKMHKEIPFERAEVFVDEKCSLTLNLVSKKVNGKQYFIEVTALEEARQPDPETLIFYNLVGSMSVLKEGKVIFTTDIKFSGFEGEIDPKALQKNSGH